MMKNKLTLVLALVTSVAFAASAHALNISPANSTADGTGFTGNPNNPNFLAFMAGLGATNELYKKEWTGTEEKDLAGSYSTALTSGSAFTISYDGGDIVGPTAWLGIKDGRNSPFWYAFNLTSLGWNGTDDIVGSGFWPSNGGISHVSLFGTRSGGPGDDPNPGDSPGVPDHGLTFVLLAGALTSLGLFRQLRRK